MTGQRLVTLPSGACAVIARSATGIGPRVWVGWLGDRTSSQCRVAPDTDAGLAFLLASLDRAATAPHLRLVS